jgi:hypothetical protein
MDSLALGNSSQNGHEEGHDVRGAVLALSRAQLLVWTRCKWTECPISQSKSRSIRGPFVLNGSFLNITAILVSASQVHCLNRLSRQWTLIGGSLAKSTQIPLRSWWTLENAEALKS